MKESAKEKLRKNNEQIVRINALYHQYALKYGLSDSEFQILYALAVLEENCSLQEVIRISGLPKQTINSSLRKMEKEEWISLVYLTKKKKKIILLEKGEKILNSSIRVFMKMEEEIIQKQNENIVDAYLYFMDIYAEELEERLDK